MKRNFTGPHCVALIAAITQLIRTTGQTTSREIERELGITKRRANTYLMHMNKQLRLIRKVAHGNGNGGICTIWTLGIEAADPDEKADRSMEPVRLIVKAWDGGVTLDPWALPVAFFARSGEVAA